MDLKIPMRNLGFKSMPYDESELNDIASTPVPNPNNGIGTRISEISKKMGGRKKAAQAAGVALSTFHRWLAGDSVPTLDSIARLAQKADVSLDWIATGKGPMSIREVINHKELMVREINSGDIRAESHAPKPTLSKADSIYESYKTRKDKAEKQYWKRSLPVSFYARLVPALSKHSSDTKMIEEMLERVISMVMMLTIDLETWPENIPDEHLEQLVAIVAATIHRNSDDDDFLF